MERRWEIGIGLFGLLFAGFVLLVWLPGDIKGAFMETTRAGKPEPGDAFFPVLLGSFIALMSLVQVVTALFGAGSYEKAIRYPRLTLANLHFLAIFMTIVLTSLAAVFWTGSLSVWLTQDGLTYRQLIDTAPYKYLGLVVGGFSMTFSIISWAEGRIRPRTGAVSVLLILLLILIFDIALTNIQLPPNADF